MDVYPDGRSIILTEGILRARYRNSTQMPDFMEPDAVYELRLDLWATANVFLTAVASGWRSRAATSHVLVATAKGSDITSEPAATYRPAINRVLHDPSRPSRLILANH
ncbi:MAG: hypothetical protein JOY61_17645 [Chloroflexi bacterium]|nr:hypothetical protein [Chloroflexota bacterium]